MKKYMLLLLFATNAGAETVTVTKEIFREQTTITTSGVTVATQEDQLIVYNCNGITCKK